MSDIPDFISVDEDFASLFEEKAKDMKVEFNPGDAVKGKITLIDSNSIFVDIGARCEGIIPIGEILDNKGEMELAEGDEVEAWVVNDGGGEISLTVKLSGEALNQSFEAAFTSKIPVEGKVLEERKGGYTVNLGGNMAFCPYSQMDLRPSDPNAHISQIYSFLITKLDDRGIVVSRRDLLDQELEKLRKKLQDELVEGDEIEGTIRRIERFGFFVDLGGVDGLVPASEVSWKRNVDLNEFVSVGEKVKCKVIGLDWDRNRITLSLRSCTQDPWDSSELSDGAVITGRVSSIQDFGIFVELLEGVEGLVHVSKLKGVEAEEGDETNVKIESVDLDQRRISLMPFNGDVTEVEEAAPLELIGTVENTKPYGIFMGLNDGRSGLLHISQLDLAPNEDSNKYFTENFAKGSEHKIEILKVENGKVSLTLPGKANDRSSTEKALKDLHKSSSSFGSLGGIFDGIKL